MSLYSEPPHHVFEDYPRRQLKGGITRRQLIGILFTEFHLSARQDEDPPAAKMKDLGAISDEELKLFFPVLAPNTEITMQADAVWGRPPGAVRPLRLFPIEQPSIFVFNLMNGELSLEYIAYQMVVHLGWPSQRAFAFVRGMFLSLLDIQVVVPKNPPLE